jgi:type IV pilus assembly protein PilC
MALDLKQYQMVKATPLDKVEKKPASTSFLNRELSLGPAINDKKKERLYLDLRNLIGSGIDLRTALELIGAEAQGKALRKILQRVKSDVENGKDLWEALSSTGRFSEFEIRSVEIGERSATLPEVFENLRIYFEARIQIKRQLMGALMYPVFVLTVALGVMYFMLTTIVPMFSDIFKQFNKELPQSTLNVIAASEFVQHNFYYLIAGIGVPIIFLYFQKARPWYRKAKAAILFNLPLFGGILKKIYLIRFSRFLYLLVQSHTPLVQALGLVRDVIGSYPHEQSLDDIAESIRKGGSLSDGLSKYPVYDRRMVSLIRVAEQNNTLAPTLHNLASQYDQEVQHRMKLTGKMIEPVIIILIGLFIGVILIAMYSPLFNLGNTLEP